ncbi:hypothetical protein CcaCcLH18_03373 [Colletotrichum camelliae]|nr:hypothetical protein CcaCcLH18_03373 [Colletotrichum camelliae]
MIQAQYPMVHTTRRRAKSLTNLSNETLCPGYTASGLVLMMASWTCNIVLYGTIFDVGGPMMLIYSTIIVTIGQSLMMSSLAELCSVYPYAGGQQAFTKSLAPRRIRRLLSYLIGWVVLLGKIATSAGCSMNSALVVGGLVQLTHPDFQLQPWAVWLLYAGFIIVSVAFCLSQRHLPLVSAVGATITLGGGIAWGISFLVMAPKASAHFAFTEFMNNSGYTHVGWVGIMSFYAPSYALYGTDGILHIVEEIKDAEINAPRAMIWSMIFSGITSLLSAFLIAFSPGNWQEYLHADLPWIPWIIDTLKSTAGGIAFITVTIVTLNFLIIVGINNAASRLAWGLARDNALPFSTALFRINSSFRTPINAIFFIVVAEMMIGLVVFGSDHAFEAIVSLGGVAIQIGYLIPVTMLLVEGRDCLPVNREFSLGRFGKPINMAFPLYVPVTASSILNMNWAVLIIGVLVLIILVDWVARGRFYYSL